MKGGSTTMPGIASAFLILPGKLDAWKRFMEEMAESRRTDMDTFERRVGYTALRAWHQTTPQGNLAIVYQEGDHPAQFLQRIAALHDPFAARFKQQVLDIHGVDFNQPPPGPPPDRKSVV